MNLTLSRPMSTRSDVPRRAAPPAAGPSVSWHTALVRSVEAEHVTLDDGSTAHIALSCFIQPRTGDRVCCLVADARYVVHVLQRSDAERSADVALPGLDRLRIATREIELQAARRLGLISLQDCELVAATGRLSLTAQNLVTRAADSLFQLARQVFCHAENIQHRAEHLFGAQAKRHWLVAEKEVRVDGELIQMG